MANRATSIVGGSLIFVSQSNKENINSDLYTEIGGVIAIASPLVELMSSVAKSKLFDNEEKKLTEFLQGAATEIWDLYFQYSKLAEILEPIEVKIKHENSELANKLKIALNQAKERVKNFLVESYEIIEEKQLVEAEKKKIILEQELKNSKSETEKAEINKRITKNNHNLETKAKQREKFPFRLWDNWEDYKLWLKGKEEEENAKKENSSWLTFCWSTYQEKFNNHLTKEKAVDREATYQLSIKEEVESLLEALDNYLYQKVATDHDNEQAINKKLEEATDNITINSLAIEEVSEIRRRTSYHSIDVDIEKQHTVIEQPTTK